LVSASRERIKALALEHPAYGCNRHEATLALEGVRVSAITIQKILNDNGLGTRICKCRMKNPQKCRTKIPHFRELGSAEIRHGRLRFSAADRVVLAVAAG
jgi:hypothetical protein